MKHLRKILLSIILLLSVAVYATTPKYIFYFIGDGMGLGQVQTLRTYFKSLNDTSIHFYDYPVAGIVSTYSANSDITDSAAAGTALACGSKTRNGMIGMDADTLQLYSVAKRMKDAGRGVAIMTSVCIDDATPAAFYASRPSRHDYYEIARQGVESGFDMLAGAYFRDPYGVKAHKQGNVFAEYEAAGYTLLRGRDGYNIADEVQQVLWLDSDTTTENRIGYAVDGDNGDMELPQMVSTGIEFLNKRFPQGFFMMVEGGAIDHMGHGNDPSGLLGEMCEFDKAVREAYEFYLQHPDETLIVITADHETGGLALGVEGSKAPALGNMQYARISKGEFGNALQQLLKSMAGKAQWSDVRTLMEEKLGLGASIPLTIHEEEALMAALQDVMDSRTKDVKTLYATFDHFTNLIFQIYSIKYGVGWTTYSHSGNPVPLFAIGAGADAFVNKGWLDNTNIPRIIADIVE